MGRLMTLAGDPLVSGEANGIALVSDRPLSLWGGLDSMTGEVIDRHHPLSGRRVVGRVLSIPAGRGSCSASGVFLDAIRAGTGPVAVILSRPDPIIALGAILGEELYGVTVPVIVLSEPDRARLSTGDRVRVRQDGTVLLQRPPASEDTLAVTTAG